MRRASIYDEDADLRDAARRDLDAAWTLYERDTPKLAAMRVHDADNHCLLCNTPSRFDICKSCRS